MTFLICLAFSPRYYKSRKESYVNQSSRSSKEEERVPYDAPLAESLRGSLEKSEALRGRRLGDFWLTDSLLEVPRPAHPCKGSGGGDIMMTDAEELARTGGLPGLSDSFITICCSSAKSNPSAFLLYTTQKIIKCVSRGRQETRQSFNYLLVFLLVPP